MQAIISGAGLWSNIRSRARKAMRRKVAIAYVTKDLIGLKAGDVLIVDASVRAIRFGETSASLLHKLCKKGVDIYSCPDLHAKVLLLDDTAIVGSANMSNSSTGLVEAAIVSDNSSTVSGVASFLAQLEEQLDKLKPEDTKRLCAIEVIRRGRGGGGSRTRKTKISPLGKRTWVLGTCDLARDPPPDEQKIIDSATRLLCEKREENLEPDWIQLGRKSRIAKEVQQGDLLIQVWRPHAVKRPKSVISSCAVLLKQETKRWTRVFLGESLKHREMSWGKFQRLLQNLGYARRVGDWPVIVLDEDLSEAILRKWNIASK